MSTSPVPHEPPPPSAELAGLQFDRATPADAPEERACESCQQPIRDVFYVAHGHTLCSDCANTAATRELTAGPRGRELLRAALYGAGGALLGTIVYFAILATTGYEIGLIAVAVGWLVGKGVAKGGNHKGGWKLQAMAMALTYFSIVASYAPLVIKASWDQAQQDQKKKAGQGAPAASPAPTPRAEPVRVGGLLIALLYLGGFLLIVPFLAAMRNPIGLIILGIGLFEAWKINRRLPLVVDGPYSVQPAPAS